MNILQGSALIIIAICLWAGAVREAVRTHTDLETGCQYILTVSGSITPRIDADGIHMGCKGLQGDRK